MPFPPTPIPEKRCYTCGKRIPRRRFPAGHLMGPKEYAKRMFCSRSCAQSRDKGGISRNAYAARSRKRIGKECECCGSTMRLHVHHVDEDWTNLKDENLQTLCVFCHQFWHATHRRLGLKPLVRMPRLAFR